MSRISTLKQFRDGIRHLVVPEIDLYAVDDGYHTMDLWRRSQTPDEIINKFRTCFLNVWQQIPEGDRDTLVNHWGLGSCRKHGSDSQDIISLTWKLKVDSRLSFYEGKYAYALGQCKTSGLELWFSSWFIKHAVPGDLEFVIAHELGHAISFARGWFAQHPCDANISECSECEVEANRYAAMWGFFQPPSMKLPEMPPPR